MPSIVHLVHIPRKKRFIHIFLAFISVFVVLHLISPLYGEEFELLNYKQVAESIDAFRAHAPAHVVQFYQKFRYNNELRYPKEYDLREDLLKIRYGKNNGSYWGSFEEVKYYDADPRMVWSVYLNELERREYDEVPFAWYDWADFHEYNKLLAMGPEQVPCEFLFQNAFDRDKLREVEGEIGEELFHVDREAYEGQRWYETQMQASDKNVIRLLAKHCAAAETVNGSSMSYRWGENVRVLDLFDKVRAEVYQFQARSFVLNTLQPPRSLTMVNGPTDVLQFNVRQSRQNASDYETVVSSGMLERFVRETAAGEEEQEQGPRIDHISKFKKFVQSDAAQKHRLVIKELDETRAVMHDGSQGYMMLQESDFEFDAQAKIRELEAREQKDSDNPLSPHDRAYLDSLRFSMSMHFAFTPKYFHEASHVQAFKKYGAHFDKRFFNGPLIVEQPQMELRLDSLIRNFQKFANANGLVSWLAHGTLYGWLYNGRTFPWDNDGDLQMPIRHLNILAQYFNQTLVLEDPSEGNGKFLIDVTSSITHRINGNGLNNIDARFIDIDSGLYIDITGLSVSTCPETGFNKYYKERSKDIDSRDIKFRDPNLIPGLNDLSLEQLLEEVKQRPDDFPGAQALIEKLIKKFRVQTRRRASPEANLSPEQIYNMNHQLKLYNCRNFHFVSLDTLNPLIKTTFHGVPALVAEKHITYLNNEYRVPTAYQYMKFRTNAFVPELGIWTTTSVLSKLMNKNQINEKVQPVHKPISSLRPEDVYKLLENMANTGMSELLATIYNSMPINEYRVKEMEIAYDNNLSRNDKIKLLNMLRNNVGPHLPRSQKDPWLYRYERRMWEEMVRAREEDCSNARQFVDNKMAYNLWYAIIKVAERNYPMFKISTSEKPPVEKAIVAEGTVDLNKVGAPVFQPGHLRYSNIFQSDPNILDR